MIPLSHVIIFSFLLHLCMKWYGVFKGHVFHWYLFPIFCSICVIFMYYYWDIEIQKFIHYNWKISVHLFKWWLKVPFKFYYYLWNPDFLTTSYFHKWSVSLCRKYRVLTTGLSVSFGDIVYGRPLIMVW